MSNNNDTAKIYFKEVFLKDDNGKLQRFGKPVLLTEMQNKEFNTFYQEANKNNDIGMMKQWFSKY